VDGRMLADVGAGCVQSDDSEENGNNPAEHSRHRKQGSGIVVDHKTGTLRVIRGRRGDWLQE
jgi:hypothetical protein